MLLLNPKSLFDAGFQMSFMAVLAILLFYPLFESVWSQPFLFDHRIFKWLWTMLAVSCAAQIGVAPLIAYYFGRFSNYFLLTNLVVVPAATLILYLSLLVLLIPSLAYLLIYIVEALNHLLSWIATLPGASIEGLHPTLLQVWMTYVIIGAVYLLLIRRTSPTRGWSASRRAW
jgi:competence protein ComEC